MRKSSSAAARLRVLLRSQRAVVEAAAVATPLAFKAMQDGYTNLGLMGPYLPDVPYMSWQANAAWATANRDTVVRFIRANNEAIAFIYNKANRNEAAQILATSSGAPLEEALKTHDLVVEIKGFAPDSAGTAEGVQGDPEGARRFRRCEGTQAGIVLLRRLLSAGGARRLKGLRIGSRIGGDHRDRRGAAEAGGVHQPLLSFCPRRAVTGDIRRVGDRRLGPVGTRRSLSSPTRCFSPRRCKRSVRRPSFIDRGAAAPCLGQLPGIHPGLCDRGGVGRPDRAAGHFLQSHVGDHQALGRRPLCNSDHCHRAAR